MNNSYLLHNVYMNAEKFVKIGDTFININIDQK